MAGLTATPTVPFTKLVSSDGWLTVSEMRADLIRILCGQLFESQKMSFASKRPCEHLSLNKHRRPTYQLGP